MFETALQMQSEAVYAVEVLLCCSTESCKGAPREPPKPPPLGDKGEMQVCIHTYVHTSVVAGILGERNPHVWKKFSLHIFILY